MIMDLKKLPSIELPLRDRLSVVVLVVLAHVWLLWIWASLPASSRQTRHEMTLSIELAGSAQGAVKSPAAEPQALAKREKSAETPQLQSVPQVAAAVDVPLPALPAAADTVSVQAVNALPVLADREPDYQAAYLNNPLPIYPVLARRMGWQGRVVLNVEVTASGWPGQIKLQQSSGHDVLDNTALQAVRGWRFEPARQGGQAVAKWFLIPIPFILKEAE